MPLAENIKCIQQKIAAAAIAAGRDPSEVTLVAATKVQTSDTIRSAIAAGITVCGENRVQELTSHLEDNAYEGAELHFIGHLQTNKVKYIVGKVALIHSVSSDRLMEAINTQAAKVSTVQDILLEVNVGREESKSGYFPEEVMDAARKAASLPNIRLRGLMAIPPVAEEPGQNRPYFARMRELFVDIKGLLGDNVCVIDSLSMGMSDDYEDAIAAGATLVRVGTAIFGARPPRITE